MLVLARDESGRIIIDFAGASDEQLLSLRSTPIVIELIRHRYTTSQGEIRNTRIGVEAPPFVAVDREEIYQSKLREKANNGTNPPTNRDS